VKTRRSMRVACREVTLRNEACWYDRVEEGESGMRDETKTCEICRAKVVFASCLGCGAGVCEPCALFELIGSGCGCVWPAYYCPKCAWDQAVNPNAIFRDPPGQDLPESN
jgi:hypothetical protein